MARATVCWLTLLGMAISIMDAQRVSGADPKLITAVEGIAEFELDNGMKVLLFPDPTKDTVTVNNTIFVGSRHEGYGEAGMAHLLEHMVFKGTPTFENIPKALRDHGAEMNGTTWLDRTNYFETMPASPENLEFALKLEADRMINSLIRAEDLASEMTVVRNEFERGENSPMGVLLERMTSAAYNWHNYGQSTIGNRADIERVPVENLREFYKKYYQPDNAMVVISGSFSPERTLALVQKYFGAIPRPERKLPTTYTEEPAQDGERMVTVRRVGDVPLVGVAYHIVSGPHPDFAATDILATSLAQAPSGRLYQELVETKLAASVTGGAYATHDPNLVFYVAQVVDGVDPQVVADKMVEVIEGFKDEPITEEEVKRSRAELLTQWERYFRNSQRAAISLSEWAAQGDWRLLFLQRDRLESAKIEDVQRVAEAFLQRSNRTLGFFVPSETADRTHVPPTPELAAMIGDYKGRAAVEQGEKFDVSPANIDARTLRKKISGGIEVSLLPKKTRGGSVDLRLTLRFGDEQSLANKSGISKVLGGMLKRGTTNRSRQDITDALNEYRSQVVFSASTAGVLSCKITTKRENLSPVLDLVRDMLANPAFEESELATLKQAYVTGQEQQLSEPQVLAQLDVLQKMRPHEAGDPRYVASIQENIDWVEEVTAEDLRTFYRSMISGNVGELSVVGDFDPDEVIAAVEPMLEKFRSDVAYARLNNPPVRLAAADAEIKTPDKANAMYFAGTVIPLRDDSEDYPALLIGNRIFGGGGALASRLGDRVRQQEGLSYGVGSMMRASAHDMRTEIMIYAISNPENMPKVKTAIREELDRIRQDGIEQEELEKAVASYIESGKVSRTKDDQLASLLEKNAEAGRTMAYTAELEQRIRSLTVDQVNAAIKKYLDPEQIVVTAAGDFKE